MKGDCSKSIRGSSKSLKNLVRCCPICDSATGEILHHQRFILPEQCELPDAYDVVYCNFCQFSFADVVAEQSVYDRYYNRSSIYEDRSSTGSGLTPADLIRLKETAATITRHAVDSSVRLLDLGCGNGGLLNELKQLGYTNLVGIDNSPSCVRYIKDDLGISAFTGAFNDLPQDIGRFDWLVLSHVLEHVRDLEGALQTTCNLLSPGGFIYVEVPDASRYAEYIEAPFQEFNTEHINHFYLGALCKLVDRFGFKLLHGQHKNIINDSRQSYPAVYGIFQLCNPVDSNSARPDQNADWFRPAIDRYIERSAEQLEYLSNQIWDLVGDGKPIYVWGTGQLTYKLLLDTCLSDANIVAFVDSNKINQNKSLAGRTIISPQQIVSSPSTAILIATMLHFPAIQKEIEEKLHLENPVVVLKKLETVS